MKRKILTFIGCGNMGEAILRGLLESSFLFPQDISFFEKDAFRKDTIKKSYNIDPEDDLGGTVKGSKYLLIAVKPQNIASLMEDVRKFFDKEQNCIISIAAGISTGYYERTLGEGASVIRVMPNTPALYKKGMITVSPGKYAVKDDVDFSTSLMGKIGRCIIIDEGLQHISTAINGSGPAYFFLFCKALIEAAKASGLESDTAKILAAATMKGAGEMLEKSEFDIDELISRVASPGGTTEKALETFKDNKLEHIVAEAVENAMKRSKELEKEMV